MFIPYIKISNYVPITRGWPTYTIAKYESMSWCPFGTKFSHHIAYSLLHNLIDELLTLNTTESSPFLTSFFIFSSKNLWKDQVCVIDFKQESKSKSRGFTSNLRNQGNKFISFFMDLF